jgi:NAD(P)-dependent dehydrogenase (short-subunit alcohol dehydrogenase family)
MKLADSEIIFTGGGSGLGAATARWFCGAGARIVIVDVDAAQAQHAVAYAVDQFGPLQGLVNCAGIALGKKVLGREGPHQLESFTRCIQVNLIGTFNMCRLAAAAMAQGHANAAGERGVIINTASIAAYEGQIGQAAYAASKAGIIGMTLPAHGAVRLTAR